jgi:Fe-S oxidoreductase
MSYAVLKPLLFAILFTAANVSFAWSMWRLVRLARLGKDHPTAFAAIDARIRDVVRYVFLQERVVDRKFGYNHVVIFWSFVIISLGHLEFIATGIIPPISGLLFETPLRFIAIPVVFGADVMALVVLFALANAFYRRLVVKPWFIAYDSLDGFAVLSMITLVMVTYFGATSAGIATAGHYLASHTVAFPVSTALASAWAGTEPGTLDALREVFWWGHAFVLLFFLNYIPYSKHQHLVGAIPNIFLREGEKPKGALHTIDLEDENATSFGVGKVTDFSWKQLVDTYACTECGRCDLNCPATNTGKPLEPQQVIHDIKGNLYANGDALLKARPLTQLLKAPAEFEPTLPLIATSEEERQKGKQTSPEVLWSCTTCGACVDACPVLIDHVGAILDMRRYLNLTQGEVSNELARTYKNIENNSNPWGIGADKRGDWAEAMGLKFWGSSEDADKYEYLFWVGCAGSYDLRAQKTVKSFTKIMDEAGVKYAILGTAEGCTGDPARRTGNEYLFDSLAKANVQTLNDYGVKKIVTACPHCLNSLKNEYKAFGGSYEVLHHSQLIEDLIDAKRIELDGELMKKVTFHDPCYLGRWNDEYEAPRRSLAAVKRLSLVEPEKNKRTSMCCGAGGGQIWMEEKVGKRINHERSEQLLATGAEVVAVACPFCMTMVEDGIKAKGADEKVQLLDIAEVVERAMKKTKAAEVPAAADGAEAS